jgi:flagellar basal-body rod protein FlgG
MNDALYIAATGLQAHQSNVDTVANNLANINTPGFKRTSANFHDVMRASAAIAEGDAAASGSNAAAPVGVKVSSTVKDFSAGDLRNTGNVMDIAIRGDGFIEVQMPDGGTAFSRGGTLMVDKDGLLATVEGHVLRPAIHVGRDISKLSIAEDGSIRGTDANGRQTPVLGRIELVGFANTSGLRAQGDRLFRSTEVSGEAVPVKLGDSGGPSIAQGFIEASNVKLVDEMVTLMVAQRAYEMNVKVIQTADEMAAMSNNLRR